MGMLVFLMIFFVLHSSALAEQVPQVPIKSLGVAPWLGPLKDKKDLLEKFGKEKKDFAGYIQHDLERAVGLKISSAEASEIVSLMASAIKESKEVSITDGTAFKSMGWRSKKTKKIMRTVNPVLQLGRSAQGFPVKIAFKDHEIEYWFLKECGNLSLARAEEILPPRAEIVPSPRAEVLPAPPPAPPQPVHYYYLPPVPAVHLPLSPPIYIQPSQPFWIYDYYSAPAFYFRFDFGGGHKSFGHYPYFRHSAPSFRPPAVMTR